MVELLRLWASTHNKFVDRFKYLYFCELDNRKVLDFYMSATELTCDQQDKIEDFYENWAPGKVMDIPHAAGQVKGTESHMTISKDAIKELGNLRRQKYRIQNALEDYPAIEAFLFVVNCSSTARSSDRFINFDAKEIRRLFVGKKSAENLELLRERIQDVLADVIVPKPCNQASSHFESLTTATEFGVLLETMEDLDDCDMALSMFKDSCVVTANALKRSKRRKISPK